MNWLDFETGLLAGCWLATGGYGIGLLLRRRRDRRRGEARASPMAEEIRRFFGDADGGVNCPCESCQRKRVEQAKGAN